MDGVVYRALSARDLGRLDRYEGREYRRRRLVVLGADGEQQAWAYLPWPFSLVSSRPWDPGTFAARGLRRWMLNPRNGL